MALAAGILIDPLSCFGIDKIPDIVKGCYRV